MPDEDRIIELETKLAYHEDIIQALNDTVVQQQKKLSSLEERYQTLVARLVSIEPPAVFEDDGIEVPPHY